MSSATRPRKGKGGAKRAGGSSKQSVVHRTEVAPWWPPLQQAIAHLRAGEPAEAQPLMQALVKDFPQQPDVLHFQGVLCHQLGRTSVGMQWLKQALGLLPESPDIWLNLGNMQLFSGQFDEARAAYGRSVALSHPPERAAQPLSNLSVLLRKQGHLDEALAAGKRAVELAPDFADAWYNLSEAHLAKGEVNEGLRAQSRAVLLLPPDIFRRQRIIRALLLLDRKEQAAEQLRQWLDEEPDNPVVQHQLLACLGEQAPERASDAYVQQVFDSFSASFDVQLERLQYKAPDLVTQALQRVAGEPAAALDIVDAGCGTGLCGPLLKPWAKRLVGCDLSVGMLQRAVPRAVYDRLVHAELVQFLAAAPASCDVVVSADTLCYFGALEAVLQATSLALRAPGWLIFTVEALPTGDARQHVLQANGRYAHAEGYVRQSLQGAGLQANSIEAVQLRMEAGVPVAGWLVVAGKS